MRNPDESVYHPFMIDISYDDEGKHYAILSSGVFTRGQDGRGGIDGIRITNQEALIDGQLATVRMIDKRRNSL